MKLTGKCKEEFNEYYDEMRWNLDDMDFKNLPESCQNALIIEFFDSMGIWKNTFNNFYVKYFRNEMTLTEATNAAIEKANSIYNEYKL